MGRHTVEPACVRTTRHIMSYPLKQFKLPNILWSLAVLFYTLGFSICLLYA